MQGIQRNIASLNHMAIGEAGTVFEVPDLRLLASLGVRIGKQVKLITRSVASGPLVFMVGDRSVVIDRALAELIKIRR